MPNSIRRWVECPDTKTSFFKHTLRFWNSAELEQVPITTRKIAPAYGLPNAGDVLPLTSAGNAGGDHVVVVAILVEG